MKITRERLKQIIKEEVELLEKDISLQEEEGEIDFDSGKKDSADLVSKLLASLKSKYPNSPSMEKLVAQNVASILQTKIDEL